MFVILFNSKYFDLSGSKSTGAANNIKIGSAPLSSSVSVSRDSERAWIIQGSCKWRGKKPHGSLFLKKKKLGSILESPQIENAPYKSKL